MSHFTPMRRQKRAQSVIYTCKFPLCARLFLACKQNHLPYKALILYVESGVIWLTGDMIIVFDVFAGQNANNRPNHRRGGTAH